MARSDTQAGSHPTSYDHPRSERDARPRAAKGSPSSSPPRPRSRGTSTSNCRRACSETPRRSRNAPTSISRASAKTTSTPVPPTRDRGGARDAEPANPPLGVFTEAVPVFNLVPAPGRARTLRPGGHQSPDHPRHLRAHRRRLRRGRHDPQHHPGSTATSKSRHALGRTGGESHDGSRGWACMRAKEVNGETCTPATRTLPPPRF